MSNDTVTQEQWTFNDRDDGLWNDSGGSFDATPEAAFQSGCDYGYEPGTSIYVGKVRQLAWKDVISACDLRGRMQELVGDMVGEAGEDFLTEPSSDEWKTLEEAIAATIEKWADAQSPKVTLPFTLDDVRYMGTVPEEEEGNTADTSPTAMSTPLKPC